jgi:uncharacterized protein (TIGR03437 family)
VVILWATGLGETSPSYPEGRIITAGDVAPLANPIKLTVGGIVSVVNWAGIVEPGLYQINSQIPATTPNGDQPIVVTVGTAQSQTGVKIPVQK